MVLILDLGYLYNRKKRGLSVILKLLVVSSIIISIQALSINEVIDWLINYKKKINTKFRLPIHFKKNWKEDSDLYKYTTSPHHRV